MDINSLITSATDMQKKILLAFAIGVIPSYFTLFMKLQGFSDLGFSTQIMLSLMMSSSIVIVYLVLVFAFDFYRCRKRFSAKVYEMCSVVYLSSLFCFIANYDINGIPYPFLSGAVLYVIPRFIDVVIFKLRVNHNVSDYKKEQDYIDNCEYPKEK